MRIGDNVIICSYGILGAWLVMLAGGIGALSTFLLIVGGCSLILFLLNE